MRVVENLYRWTEWTMLSETLDGKPIEHNQLSSQQVEWLVPVPAGGEAVLEYEVQYRWK